MKKFNDSKINPALAVRLEAYDQISKGEKLKMRRQVARELLGQEPDDVKDAIAAAAADDQKRAQDLAASARSGRNASTERTPVQYQQ